MNVPICQLKHMELLDCVFNDLSEGKPKPCTSNLFAACRPDLKTTGTDSNKECPHSCDYKDNWKLENLPEY